MSAERSGRHYPPPLIAVKWALAAIALNLAVLVAGSRIIAMWAFSKESARTVQVVTTEAVPR
jgi:hypothetical protein